MSSSIPFPSDDDLLRERIISIDSLIDDQSANITIAKLLFLKSVNSQLAITIYINSPGGSVTATLAIIDTMATLGLAVHTYALQKCHGCALLVLIVGSHRHALKKCALSIQVITLGMPEPKDSTDSKIQDLAGKSANRAAMYLEKINDRLAKTFLQYTRLTEVETREALANGRSFSSEEAFRAGFVDFLVDG